MSGAGFGRIDRRRRMGRLRRLHEADRQRRAAYNLLRGRMSPQTVAAQARADRVVRRRARRAPVVFVDEAARLMEATPAELAAGTELGDLALAARKTGAMEWQAEGDAAD